MSNETDSFVTEVDEGLRQDRMLVWLKRYGPWLAGAFVVLVVGVLGWQFYRGWQLDRARAHAEEYVAAQELLQRGDVPGAKAAFANLSEEGPAVYRAMARMEHAAILVMEGDLEPALEAFDRVAEDAPDPVMQKSAALRAAYLAAETEDFAALQQRLQPLIDDGGRFSYPARELLAVEAWEAGQVDLARETMQGLALAFDAPEGVRQRAQLALQVFGPAPSSTTADGAAETPAPSEGESK